MKRIWNAEIFVALKPSILDAPAKQVQEALIEQLKQPVDKLRMGKWLTLTFGEPMTQEEASERLDNMCKEFLANLVIETYHFKLSPTEEQAVESQAASSS